MAPRSNPPPGLTHINYNDAKKKLAEGLFLSRLRDAEEKKSEGGGGGFWGGGNSCFGLGGEHPCLHSVSEGGGDYLLLLKPPPPIGQGVSSFFFLSGNFD